MTTPKTIAIRRGREDDALCVAVLATQVFLDTYAEGGIRPDLAREVLTGYSQEAFARRLADPATTFLLAELVRLYVQRPFLRQGLGTDLIHGAEKAAFEQGAGALWLSAWSGNRAALAFCRACGYRTAGTSEYVFEGRTYQMKVVVKDLADSR